MTLYHQRYRKRITLENARAWAKWLAQRYKDAPNIVWSMTPEAKPEFVPVLRELAAGLREGDGGRHLITFKPDPSPYSSSFIHDEEWLDFNSHADLERREADLPDGHQGLQPQAGQAGAHGRGRLRGGHGIRLRGHAAVGPPAGLLLLPGRRPSHLRAQRQLADPAHVEAGPRRARRGADGRPQEDLPGPQAVVVPRRPTSPFWPPAGKTDGDVLHLAARHKDGNWVMVYLADKATFSVNLNKLGAAKNNALWIDPRTGKATPIGQETNAGVKSFTTPDGWEDALLVLEATDGPA